MKYPVFFALFSLLVLAACSTEGVFDPTMVGNGFTGITYMDETADHAGPVDSRDWNLYAGDITAHAIKFENDVAAYKKVSLAGLSILPAFPNPFNGSQTLMGVFSQHEGSVSVRIVNTAGETIREFEGQLDHAAAVFSWAPDRCMSPDPRDCRILPGGIYRVCYIIELADGSVYSGYGDTWLIYNVTEY